MGVGVGVSVGDGVSVGSGVSVSVRVEMGVKVSVLGMLVDVEAGSDVEEAGACPELQASVARISNTREGSSLIFIPRLYPKLLIEQSPLSSSPRPEGGRSG